LRLRLATPVPAGAARLETVEIRRVGGRRSNAARLPLFVIEHIVNRRGFHAVKTRIKLVR